MKKFTPQGIETQPPGAHRVGRSPPKFGRSVNPIQTRGADYALHTTASPPPQIHKAIYTSVDRLLGSIFKIAMNKL